MTQLAQKDINSETDFAKTKNTIAQSPIWVTHFVDIGTKRVDFMMHHTFFQQPVLFNLCHRSLLVMMWWDEGDYGEPCQDHHHHHVCQTCLGLGLHHCW